MIRTIGIRCSACGEQRNSQKSSSNAFADSNEWKVYLQKNQDSESAIWLKLAKKHSRKNSVTYEEAREAALMFGWIDGLINKYDEDYYQVRFSARRANSRWSKINRGIAEQLIRSKQMQPRGLAEVTAAKSDGRWDAAYDSPSTIEIPDDLRKQLNRNQKAKKFFDSLSRTNRYAFLYRIQSAKKPATRKKWVEKTVEMLSKKQTIH